MLKHCKNFFLFICCVISFQNINAQGAGGGSNRIEGDFKFMPTPYINYNRSLGFQFGGIPLVQFNPVSSDTLSPSSMAGLIGLYTTNKSYMVMGFSQLYFDKDNWRMIVAGGFGSINFQFYLSAPFDMWIPYNTDLSLFLIEAQRRIYNRIYLGLSYQFINFNSSVENHQGELIDNLNGIGGKIIMDYRDNVYYTRNGFFLNAKIFSYPEFMGNEEASTKLELSINRFFPIRQNIDVLAFRIFAGVGLGELSFNQQFIVNNDDIRGYSQGEFRGNNIFTVQSEYRWNIKDTRFGFVGFLAAATLTDAFNDDHNGKILPGIGVGFRYTVFEETHTNVGLDFAKGDGDWGIYFKIGEAFNK